MFKSVTTRAARRVAQPTSFAACRHLHAPLSFDWKDPLGASNLYTEEEIAIAEVAEDYCQERMLPRVLGMLQTCGTLKRPSH
jgi:glutaryl-CoA dehydrogenase